MFEQIVEKIKIARNNNKNYNFSRVLTEKEYKLYFETLYKDFYLDKKWTFTEIYTKFNISEGTLRRGFKKCNLFTKSRHHSLHIREDLFESITTEEDAYWLGFIYADGYISDKGRFEISLKSSDYEHLLKFADYCGFDKSKVIKSQNTNFENSKRCRIGFSTISITERFFNLGIVPRKSLILTYPDFLNECLHKHFIRGYVDGDGSFNTYFHRTHKYPYTNINFTLLGTFEMLSEIQKQFKTNKNYYKKNNNDNGTLVLSFSGKKAKKILNWLYEDSTIYLDRKYEIYKNKIAVF